MAAKSPLGEAGQRALKHVEEATSFHDEMVAACDKRWRAFEGQMARNAEAARWHSQLHPPFLNHIVETQLAGLLDERISFRVKPMPRFFNPGEYLEIRQGAKAHEILARHQLARDRFDEFQRPYTLDAAVTGLGVASTVWLNKTVKRKRNIVENAADPELAAQGAFIPRMVTVERVETEFDGPVTEALDPRDCYWHEAATSLEKSRFFAQAVWMTYADLVAEAKLGRYDMEAVKQLEHMTDENAGRDYTAERRHRGRRKDMIEVLWVWDRELARCTVIGARAVQLRDRPWPFWHGQYPFTIVSLQPYPRAIRGMSMVEKLGHLQDAAWDLMNQRIDNVRFLNNAITIMRADTDDPDRRFEPGAIWYDDDPASVQQYTPNPLPAEISLGAEAQILQHMQNLAGSQPFTSTSESRSVGANTATEAALVTNLAQLATKQMKLRLYGAYERIGQQRIWLNQQFIREPVYVDVPAAQQPVANRGPLEEIGIDTTREGMEILPHLLVGDYLFDVQAMTESLSRAERRSEASSRFQVFTRAAPVLTAMGVAMNARRLVEDVLDSWDVEDKDAYFSAVAPPAVPGGPDQPGQQGSPQNGGLPGGVTAPQATDPATSPSVQASLSGATPMARQLSMSGGVSNT